jgi:hypothetical protein
MPYLNDAQLREQLAQAGRSNADIVPYDDNDAPLGVMPLICGMGAATVMGFIRSKLEDPNTGEWNLPGTRWDAEAVAFAALCGVAFGGQYVGLDQWRGYAALSAVGVGSHFAGEVARRFGKTGKLTLVGSGLPPWDPTSFDPTQFPGMNDDAQARGLASSGV